MSKNLGYGICGAKNIYSEKALLDNFSEDRFGKLIVEQGARPGKPSYMTNTMITHCAPSDMPPHPNAGMVKLESAKDIMRRNKEGMPYNLLFTKDEGPKANPRFETTLQRVQAAGCSKDYAIPDGAVLKSLQRNIRREVTQQARLITTTNESQKWANKGDEIPRMSEGPLEELPNWTRTAYISSMGM
jgi:hypothetical protein